MEQEIEQMLGDLRDEVTTSSSILKSELLRKVVADVSGSSNGSNETPRVAWLPQTRRDEDSMSNKEVVDALVSIVNEQAGRDYVNNEVINFFVCLSQCYITTFAGLPGTGKTSLCHILAASLGLLNESGPSRFCEIPVENGWTSYRDYIGYHNPLTRRHEIANPGAY